MIIHTLTSVQSGKSYPLQHYIDNRDNTKSIALKSIVYWVGWYNLKPKQYFTIKNKKIDLEEGLYNFNDIKDILADENIDLTVNQSNGIATIEIPQNTSFEMSSNISSLLGFAQKHKALTPGRHTGNTIINFAKPKELQIFLDQINTTTNFVNGMHSKMLIALPISDRPFGRAVFHQFGNPIFKQLANGSIDELCVRITDENGVHLDNHGLPISVELIIV